MFSVVDLSYLLGSGVLLGGVYLLRNYSYRIILFEAGCIYLNVETKIIKIKNRIEKSLVKFKSKKNIEFYCDGYKIFKTNIESLDEKDFPLEFDYIICKQKNENNEEMYRFFESELELMDEIKNNNKIIFTKCPVTILNCKLIMKDEGEKVMHNITPFKSAYYSGNKLYTKNFIKHFYNIDLFDKYVVKFIDSNIKSVELENREIILLGDNSYEIKELNKTEEKFTQNDEKEKINLKESLYEYALDPEVLPSVIEEINTQTNENDENDEDWEQPNNDSFDIKRKKWLSSI